MAKQVYTVGSPILSVPFNCFTPQINCNMPITYTFTLSGGYPLPGFITSSTTNPSKGCGFVNIYATSRFEIPMLQAAWTIIIKGQSEAANPSDGVIDETQIVLPLAILIINKGPPAFTKNLVDIKLMVANL